MAVFHFILKKYNNSGEGGAIYVKKSEAHRIPGLRHNGHSNFLQNRKILVLQWEI